MVNSLKGVNWTLPMHSIISHLQIWGEREGEEAQQEFFWICLTQNINSILFLVCGDRISGLSQSLLFFFLDASFKNLWHKLRFFPCLVTEALFCFLLFTLLICPFCLFDSSTVWRVKIQALDLDCLASNLGSTDYQLGSMLQFLYICKMGTVIVLFFIEIYY